MFYKALPYILLLIGAIGVYQFVDSLKVENQELTKAKTTLEGESKAQIEKLAEAQRLTTKQQADIADLKAGFELEQQVAKKLAEQETKAHAALQVRLTKLIEDAKNDPEDNCSFSPMPDHIVRMLFNTDQATSANSHNSDSDREVTATSKFNPN